MEKRKRGRKKGVFYTAVLARLQVVGVREIVDPYVLTGRPIGHSRSSRLR